MKLPKKKNDQTLPHLIQDIREMREQNATVPPICYFYRGEHLAALVMHMDPEMALSALYVGIRGYAADRAVYAQEVTLTEMPEGWTSAATDDLVGDDLETAMEGDREDIERLGKTSTIIVVYDMRRDGSWEMVQLPFTVVPNRPGDESSDDSGELTASAGHSGGMLPNHFDGTLGRITWPNPKWCSSKRGDNVDGPVMHAARTAYGKPTQVELLKGAPSSGFHGIPLLDSAVALQTKADFETSRSLTERGCQVIVGQPVSFN